MEFLVIFVDLFLDKKGVAHFRLSYTNLCYEFVETNWIFSFLSEKYPISKKNRPKRSLGNQDINILNLEKFQGFSRKRNDLQSKLFLQTLVLFLGFS
jgi:hypothetical protein